MTEVLRRFNRTYTQRVGVLDESFLGLGRALAPSRLLFEIGTTGADVRGLRQRLGLDSGHLSRLLRSLEDERLIEVTPLAGDARRRRAALTQQGRAELDRVEEASRTRAASVLAGLTPGQQDRLAQALATAETLVRASGVTLTEVDPAGDLASTAMRRYVAELDGRFPGGFDPGPLPPPETVVVVVEETAPQAPVACGGLQTIAPGVGEVKRVWVDGACRGAGLGSRVVRHLEGLALERGLGTVRLDSNGTLVEAIAMYERMGYTPIDRYNDNPYAEVFLERRLSLG